MPFCVTCGEEKDESQFNWRWKSLGIKQKSCQECQHGHQANYYQNHIAEERERTRRRKVRVREEAREFVRNYLSTHGCVDCGETDPRVLEFDHVRGKAANVAKLISEGASIERLQIEIGLTEVRCANCHRKRTAGQGGWFKGKKQ